MALINSTGKSDDQYTTDLDQATKIIESKSRLALGGMNAANQNVQAPTNDLSQMSDEELKKIVNGG